MNKKIKEAENLMAVHTHTHTHGHFKENGITLIAFAISRKCVRYEERA